VKRSFGKRVALILWFVGSCGAVLFACWWFAVTVLMIHMRKFSLTIVILLAGGVLSAWKGFKIFKEERDSK